MMAACPTRQVRLGILPPVRLSLVLDRSGVRTAASADDLRAGQLILGRTISADLWTRSGFPIEK